MVGLTENAEKIPEKIVLTEVFAEPSALALSWLVEVTAAGLPPEAMAMTRVLSGLTGTTVCALSAI